MDASSLKVGERLRFLRKQKGISQAELVELLKQSKYELSIRQSWISDIERSSQGHLPSPLLLAAFASVFETSTDYLLGLTDDPRVLERAKKQQRSMLLI